VGICICLCVCVSLRSVQEEEVLKVFMLVHARAHTHTHAHAHTHTHTHMQAAGKHGAHAGGAVPFVRGLWDSVFGTGDLIARFGDLVSVAYAQCVIFGTGDSIQRDLHGLWLWLLWLVFFSLLEWWCFSPCWSGVFHCWSGGVILIVGVVFSIVGMMVFGVMAFFSLLEWCP